MTKVSALNSSDDWQFGRGKASYVMRSDAIRQDVKTRLKSFKNDWFADINQGEDWFIYFGTRGNQELILRIIERVVLQTTGVRQINILRIESLENRSATIKLSYTDVFDSTIEETFTIL